MTLGLIMIEAMPAHPMGHEGVGVQRKLARHADAAMPNSCADPLRDVGVMSYA
jgi:hypothetical protein